MNNTIYVVIVLDDSITDRPPYQRTPGIFTSFDDAALTIQNNVSDISEGGTNKYAIIEETTLNEILPRVCQRVWFKWNNTDEEYKKTKAPVQFTRVESFGIC